MAIRAHTTDIARLEATSIVVDTNVLLYVFGVGASTGEMTQAEYSQAFIDARNSGKQLYVDYVIVSEFLNRELKLAFELYKDRARNGDLSFKRDYRQTDDFREVLSSLSDTVCNRILKLCRVTNHRYDRSQLAMTVQQLGNSAVDLNDLHIAELAKELDALVLTNDGDFARLDVSTISANPRLLR